MSFLSDPLSSDPLCPPSPSERLGVSGEHKRLLGETRAESAKRRRIAGDSQYGLQGLINGTIIEEDLTMTEGLSEDGAKAKETLESLGDRRKATLVNSGYTTWRETCVTC
jgi:hypothetical protein